MKKNGIFLFVISSLVPEIFKIFVLCKLGTNLIAVLLAEMFSILCFDFHVVTPYDVIST